MADALEYTESDERFRPILGEMDVLSGKYLGDGTYLISARYRPPAAFFRQRTEGEVRKAIRIDDYILIA
jgi:hypothetical protein